MIENVVVIAVVVIIVGAALYYIIKEKKNGNKCIGCPAAKSCKGHCGGCDDNKQ